VAFLLFDLWFGFMARWANESSSRELIGDKLKTNCGHSVVKATASPRVDKKLRD
jgi:hypothetical protein